MAVGVLGVDVGARLHEELQEVDVPVLSGDVDARVAVLGVLDVCELLRDGRDGRGGTGERDVVRGRSFGDRREQAAGSATRTSLSTIVLTSPILFHRMAE